MSKGPGWRVTIVEYHNAGIHYGESATEVRETALREWKEAKGRIGGFDADEVCAALEPYFADSEKIEDET